jgi:hypothetical protein
VKLYIWEGNGISDGYHDDGTLVVLADSPEHARQVVAGARRAYANALRRAAPKVAAVRAEMDEFARANGGYRAELWRTPEGRALSQRQAAAMAVDPGLPDGETSALAREPDRVVELDKPTIVAFNGGGYD